MARSFFPILTNARAISGKMMSAIVARRHSRTNTTTRSMTRVNTSRMAKAGSWEDIRLRRPTSWVRRDSSSAEARLLKKLCDMPCKCSYTSSRKRITTRWPTCAMR